MFGISALSFQRNWTLSSNFFYFLNFFFLRLTAGKLGPNHLRCTCPSVFFTVFLSVDSFLQPQVPEESHSVALIVQKDQRILLPHLLLLFLHLKTWSVNWNETFQCSKHSWYVTYIHSKSLRAVSSCYKRSSPLLFWTKNFTFPHSSVVRDCWLKLPLKRRPQNFKIISPQRYKRSVSNSVKKVYSETEHALMVEWQLKVMMARPGPFCTRISHLKSFFNPWLQLFMKTTNWKHVFKNTG